MRNNKKSTAGIFLIGGGCLFGIWALAAMVSGLHRARWSVTEFIRSGLVASGMVQPIHTMVDFYTHIKGIEYIICVGFFVVFPLFFRFVDKPERRGSVVTEGEKTHEDTTI